MRCEEEKGWRDGGRRWYRGLVRGAAGASAGAGASGGVMGGLGFVLGLGLVSAHLGMDVGSFSWPG